MALGGGSRVSSFTIMISVILIIFSIITSGVIADYNASNFVNEFTGVSFNWDFAESYSESEYGNLSRPAYLSSDELILEDLTPDAKVIWQHNFLGEQFFRCQRKGYEFYDSWLYYGLEPNRLWEDDVLAYRKDQVYAKVTYDIGGVRQVDVFYYPRFYVNGTGDINLVYDSLEESFENDVVSVIVGTNATYPSYDIFSLFTIVTSFDSYAGIPYEVNILIKAIFWGLILLLIVKLFVG